VLHDFGGPFGLLWADDHLDRVASITLVNTGLLRDYGWHQQARIYRTPILGELLARPPTYAVLERALNAKNPKPLPPAFLREMFSHMDRGYARAVLALYRSTVLDIDEERVRRLRERDLPGQVIWGEGDTYIPTRYAEAQKEILPSAEVHLLPGCGHWPMIDDEDAVRAKLLPFLESKRERGVR